MWPALTAARDCRTSVWRSTAPCAAIIGRTVSRLLLAVSPFCSLIRVCRRRPSEPHTLKGHDGWVGGVAFSPDGKTLATASADNTAKSGTSSRASRRRALKGHTDHVAAVAFSPDGRSVATASYDHDSCDCGTRRPAEGRHVLEVTAGRSWRSRSATTAASSPPAGSTATSACGTRCTGKEVASSRTQVVGERPRVRPGRRDAGLGQFGQHGEALGRAATAKCGPLLKPNAAEIRCVAFSPDGSLVAAGTRYGLVKVWDTVGRQERADAPRTRRRRLGGRVQR